LSFGLLVFGTSLRCSIMEKTLSSPSVWAFAGSGCVGAYSICKAVQLRGEEKDLRELAREKESLRNQFNNLNAKIAEKEAEYERICKTKGPEVMKRLYSQHEEQVGSLNQQIKALEKKGGPQLKKLSTVTFTPSKGWHDKIEGKEREDLLNIRAEIENLQDKLSRQKRDLERKIEDIKRGKSLFWVLEGEKRELDRQRAEILKQSRTSKYKDLDDRIQKVVRKKKFAGISAFVCGCVTVFWGKRVYELMTEKS